MEADLRDALIAWQGGELPDGRADELLAKLRADADFRRAFAAEVWTLSLTRIAQAPDPRWLALQEELGLSATTHDAVGDAAFEDAVMDTVRSEPVRFVPAWWRRAAYGAIAASVALAIGIAVWSVRATKIEVASGAKRQMFAVVVQSEKAVWKGKEDKRFASGAALSAERLQLASGRASLMFTTGVMLDFEGPADLELLTADRVVFREGRLRTRVPRGAEGFCVETPRGAVTDLGTEMGISVSPDGKTHVAVFDGQAEVALQIPGQQGVRTALLNKSETAELQPSTGEIRPESKEAFLAASALRLPELQLAPRYAESVLAAKPLHYWRLDRARDGAIPNEIDGAPVLRLADGASIERDEFGRMSALFRGRKGPGALYLNEPWSKPAKSYAVELWFATDSMELMSLFALTVPGTRSRHIALVETGSRRPGHNTEAGILRYLTRWPADSHGGMNIYSLPAAFPYQWHHLLAQQSDGDMQLFIDGKSIGTARADTFPGAVQCAVQFGCLAYRQGDAPEKLQRLFSGRLAEIAIYDRLLTPEEILRHASPGGSRGTMEK
jgi:concanavalin A-like lectin/glucanase superfamily protein